MRTGNYPYTLLILLVVCMMTGCGDRAREDSFNEIENRISADPKAAVLFVDSLVADSTWSAGMSKAERARFDLLRVKSADKAYVRHTSDSLIRTVLEYYEKHPGSDQYPEALYYGGRVYSDLGDSPTALRYFQQALDALPRKEENKRLRSAVLVQMAYILDRMRIYDEAIPFMKENIELLRELGDSMFLADNLQLLGALHMHKRDFDEAEKLFRESRHIAEGKSDGLAAKADMYLAAVSYQQKDYATALRRIRGVPERMSGNYYPQALAYAANIYLENGIADTARIYAGSLIRCGSSNNRHLGYNILLHDPVRKSVPADSLEIYYDRYTDLVNENQNRNADALGLLQATVYNYNVHDRERTKAERTKERLRSVVIVISLFATICIIVIICLKYRNKRQLLDLVVATRQIEHMRDELTETARKRAGRSNDSTLAADSVRSVPVHKDKEESSPDICDGISGVSHDSPREDFINKLLLLLEEKNVWEPLPDSIRKSEVYGILQEKIRERKGIPEDSGIWLDLERTVDACFPQFNTSLRLLARGKLFKSEHRMAMLVRCGVSTRELQYLLGISKGGVSSRRIRFGQKFFDSKLATDDVDRLIRSL